MMTSDAYGQSASLFIRGLNYGADPESKGYAGGQPIRSSQFRQPL